MAGTRHCSLHISFLRASSVYSLEDCTSKLVSLLLDFRIAWAVCSSLARLLLFHP